MFKNGIHGLNEQYCHVLLMIFQQNPKSPNPEYPYVVFIQKKPVLF